MEVPEIHVLLDTQCIKSFIPHVLLALTLHSCTHFDSHPTQSATTANMEVPEIQGNLVRDGKIVNEDGSIKVIKMAVDYVWNLPALSARINMTEDELRGCIYRYTHQEAVKVSIYKFAVFYSFSLLVILFDFMCTLYFVLWWKMTITTYFGLESMNQTCLV
jgi:hypothetical protein